MILVWAGWLAGTAAVYGEFVWTTLDIPGAQSGAYVTGICNGSPVAYYNGAGTVRQSSAVYDGTDWIPLQQSGLVEVVANGSTGSDIVGWANSGSKHSGFRFDGTTWTTLDYPGADATYVEGASDSKLVGTYLVSNKRHGFIRDGSNWRTLDIPGARTTWPYGISGNKIVGLYTDATGHGYGFLYDLATSTSQTLPNYPGALTTYFYDISGDNIVGSWLDSSNVFHGFLYNGTRWTTFDYPGSHGWTRPLGVDGLTVFGNASGSDGQAHGFIVTLPEPATLWFLIGGLGLAIRSKRRLA
jgi:hypothetical protein